jgi:hypothetical protein
LVHTAEQTEIAEDSGDIHTERAELLQPAFDRQTLAGTMTEERKGPMTTDVDLQRDILAIERERVAAMVNRDLATLDKILADDLTYTHSGGRTDTKASFVALIAAAAFGRWWRGRRRVCRSDDASGRRSFRDAECLCSGPRGCGASLATR